MLANGFSQSWKSPESMFPNFSVVILIETTDHPRMYLRKHIHNILHFIFQTLAQKGTCKDPVQRNHPSPALARGSLTRASPSYAVATH